MATKDRPTRYQMTVEWKALAASAMAARNLTRAELARRLNVHKTVVSALFDRQTASALVPQVCEQLGIPMPVLGVRAELAAIFEGLSPEDQETVLALARRLAE